MCMHFTSVPHHPSQASVEQVYRELVQLPSARHHSLVQARQLLQFMRECEDVEVWVWEEVVAANYIYSRTSAKMWSMWR